MLLRINMLFTKIYFIFRRLGVYWYFSQRWVQFKRLMTNTSVLPSVVLGIIAIYVSILLAIITHEENVTGELAFFTYDIVKSAIIVFIITSFLLSAGGRYFFTSQTPEIYADYSVKGRPLSDAIKYISYCIWKECKFLEKHKKLFEKFDTLIAHKGNAAKCDLTEYDMKRIKRLQSRMNSRQKKIQRIDSMIVSLSDAMNVPANRLSDYLFQFSPEIYDTEFRRLIKRMKEVINILASNNSDKRREQQSIKISNFFSIVSKRIGYQASIIQHTDLHDAIIDMSSGFGLTNALESYCLGLQMIARSEKAADVSMKEIRIIMDKIKFLYHKRRMFPGFDLHSILINYAHQNKLKKMLNGLTILATEKNEPLYQKYGEVTPNLFDLVNEINNYIFRQREDITVKVKEYLKEELKNPLNANKKKIVAITQGFSGVVNDTLFNVMVAIQDDTEFDRLLKGKDIYYYVLLSPKEMDSQHLTTSRYVRYKFKENPNIPEFSNYRVNVKIGDEDWLKKRFDRKDECLSYILSGAEFFQRQSVRDEKGKNTGEEEIRLINNEGFYKVSDWGFKEPPQHIVLAEKFKEFPRPLGKYKKDIARNYKIAFNRDHLEYTHLYDWNSKRKIITGN